MTKTLKDLKPNPKNPRKISDEKLELLKKTVAEFGDLSGFVFNRKTKRLVGGHQRTKVLPPESKIVITKAYIKPTKLGTISSGYVDAEGERFAYREVIWDESREKLANIAANKGAGEWDDETLGNWFKDLNEFGDLDLDLSGFDSNERAGYLIDPEAFKPGTAEAQSKLDEKKKSICPNCGEAFLVAGRQ